MNFIVVNEITVNIIRVMANKSANLIELINHDPSLSIILGSRNDSKFKIAPTKTLDIIAQGIANLIYNCLIILSL